MIRQLAAAALNILNAITVVAEGQEPPKNSKVAGPGYRGAELR